jgi:hypothetical protein
MFFETVWAKGTRVQLPIPVPVSAGYMADTPNEIWKRAMTINQSRKIEMHRFEILAARLYVQDRMSTSEIGERLGCARQTVLEALKRCGKPVEKRPAMFT